MFKIRVQPRSSRNKIVGLYDDALKVMLTAPPVDNAANESCCAFLAKQLNVKKTSVTVQSGHTGRNKMILVQCPHGRKERAAICKRVMDWVKQ